MKIGLNVQGILDAVEQSWENLVNNKNKGHSLCRRIRSCEAFTARHIKSRAVGG